MTREEFDRFFGRGSTAGLLKLGFVPLLVLMDGVYVLTDTDCYKYQGGSIEDARREFKEQGKRTVAAIIPADSHVYQLLSRGRKNEHRESQESRKGNDEVKRENIKPEKKIPKRQKCRVHNGL